ncbi:hypothetical protein [Kitasatospora sp. NPDC089509]|uniref:hypothetical protein n=1 Tax=Kitasatospora sp. NPDC089509 TaxID=3364079 RepID=UPI0038217831
MGKKSELDDLRERLATLEAEVDRLRGRTATTEAAAATEATAATKTAIEATTEAATKATEAATRTDTTAAVTTGPSRAKARPIPQARPRALDTVHEELPTQPGLPAHPGQPQSMTSIADVLGVMVSGRVEEPTRILRAHPEPAELPAPPEDRTVRATDSRSASPAGHGQFLEGLLSGRPALQP